MKNLVLYIVFSICSMQLSAQLSIDFEAYFSDKSVNKEIINKCLELKRRGELTCIDSLKAQTRNLRCKLNLVQNSSNAKQTNIYARLKKSVVIVNNIYCYGDSSDCGNNSASGFIISEQGICVSNAHVFSDYENKYAKYIAVTVCTSDGQVLPVTEILAYNKNLDLAIFRVKTNKKLVPIPIKKKINIGDHINLLSHPDGRFYSFSEGIICRKYSSKQEGVKRMNITADFAKGSSGAPVCDDYGNVIAVVAATDYVYYKAKQNQQMVIKECIPIESLFELIDLN